MGRIGSRIVVGALMALLGGCGADAGLPPEAVADPDWATPTPGAAESARGELFRHSSGVELVVPQGWKVEPRDDEVRLLPPDASLLARLLVLETAELDTALDAVDRRLDRALPSHDIGRERAAVINGLDARLASGSGRLGGESVKLRVALVLTPGKQVLALVAMVRQSASPLRQAQLSDLVRAIRPAPLSGP